MTSSELPPMVVQYTGHVIQTETRDQYTALLLVGVLLHIYEFSYIFDTVLYQFLETETSDTTFTIMGRDQELTRLAFSLYPLSFFLYSPFKMFNIILTACYTMQCLLVTLNVYPYYASS